MQSHASVEAYLASQPQWKAELDKLRKLLLATELEETLKWGAPCYTLDGKNVVGIAGFKTYVGLWFHQGVFLRDPNKVLINAQEGTTKALRQWRFQSAREIKLKDVRAYVTEAVQNQKAGKVMGPTPKTALPLPAELKQAFQKSAAAQKAFAKLTPGRQREYAEFIHSAKREATRLARLTKVLPLIRAGVGLNDKYRDC